jgi:hypothetical protein
LPKAHAALQRARGARQEPAWSRRRAQTLVMRTRLPCRFSGVFKPVAAHGGLSIAARVRHQKSAQL